MDNRSNLSFEPFLTPEELFKDMVQVYLDEKGYIDIYDAYKILLPIDPKIIGIQLFSIIEDTNTSKMLESGYCPDCAERLVRRVLPATQIEPSEEWIECPECREEFTEALKH